MVRTRRHFLDRVGQIVFSEEDPARRVSVGGLWIDAAPVTNRLRRVRRGCLNVHTAAMVSRPRSGHFRSPPISAFLTMSLVQA